ncbi:MAG: UDP-N-acetylmuramate dehydrogenase [Clostridia bacterium]|nr:UDP-N-acetylmuramate dehydrogenase [Clostridia bacterium]
MLYSSIKDKLISEGISVKEKVSGALLSTFGSGGIIEYLAEPLTVDQLKITLSAIKPLPCPIIGGGSNTLIADGGLPFAVSIRRLSSITVSNNCMECSAGSRVQTIAALAENSCLSGAEFLCGIPGTFGGAVCLNAGAFGREFKDILVSVTLLENNALVKYTPQQLCMEYRNGNIGDRIVVGGAIRLEEGSAQDIRKRTLENKEYRSRTQPIERSLGSVFKRVDGQSAAVYIEQTGLKGIIVGGAQLSTRHCNFIVNRGGAKSVDYIAIADLVSNAVKTQGIDLEMENNLLGYE